MAFDNLPDAVRERLSARRIDAELSYRRFLKALVSEGIPSRMVDQFERLAEHEVTHGLSAYNKGVCRCDVCRAAKMADQRRYRSRPRPA